MKTTTNNGLTFAVLTSVQKAFLNIYKPCNDMITSLTEMQLVEKNLDLDDCKGEELRYMRNAVVEYYSDKIETAPHSEGFDLMTSMQSVTSVIDHKMYHSGVEL